MEIASSERENVRRDLDELAGVKSERVAAWRRNIHGSTISALWKR